MQLEDTTLYTLLLKEGKNTSCPGTQSLYGALKSGDPIG